ALRGLIGQGRVIDRQFLEELEDLLIAADIGITKTEQILEDIQERFKEGEAAEGEALLDFLKRSLREELEHPGEREINFAESGPTVVLVVGVNGTGKTTSIAKLAKRFKDQGKNVILAAGDTYRAAAIEQLSIWAERVGVDIIKQHDGADAAAVAYDAVKAASARNADIVLIDTAGRLHNRDDLMRELEKIRRVIQKTYPDAPHECLLIIDATSGQNAIQQARIFGESMGVTGIILSKLDGTAKGGCAVSIKRELGLPIRYIGVGEQMDDLQPFDPDGFIEAIFGDITDEE
ncbi:MAG: signal recognition particle-docking protein FtsY, partial [Planctomycetes bacterium]|nr:signal recognition particle-docking protein FtsY [Planctomycetota bacterium]